MKAKKYVSLYLISLLSGRSKNNSFPIAKVCALIDLHRMTIFFLACEGTGQGGGSGEYKFELLDPSFLMENLDQYGNFSWKPDFDFVTPDEIIKSIPIKIKVFDTEGNDFSKPFHYLWSMSTGHRL
jgi:hypothetical protein